MLEAFSVFNFEYSEVYYRIFISIKENKEKHVILILWQIICSVSKPGSEISVIKEVAFRSR